MATLSDLEILHSSNLGFYAISCMFRKENSINRSKRTIKGTIFICLQISISTDLQWYQESNNNRLLPPA